MVQATSPPAAGRELSAWEAGAAAPKGQTGGAERGSEERVGCSPPRFARRSDETSSASGPTSCRARPAGGGAARGQLGRVGGVWYVAQAAANEEEEEEHDKDERKDDDAGGGDVVDLEAVVVVDTGASDAEGAAKGKGKGMRACQRQRARACRPKTRSTSLKPPPLQARPSRGLLPLPGLARGAVPGRGRATGVHVKHSYGWGLWGWWRRPADPPDSRSGTTRRSPRLYGGGYGGSATANAWGGRGWPRRVAWRLPKRSPPMEVSHLRWVAIGPVRLSRRNSSSVGASRRRSRACPVRKACSSSPRRSSPFWVDPECYARTRLEAVPKARILYYRPVVRTLEQHSDEENRPSCCYRYQPAVSGVPAHDHRHPGIGWRRWVAGCRAPSPRALPPAVRAPDHVLEGPIA